MRIDLKKHFLVISGILCLLLFLWFKFVRVRLPRELPFSLTLIKAFSLLLTCMFLSYAIYRLILKNNKTNSLLFKRLFALFKAFHSLLKSELKKVFLNERFIVQLEKNILYTVFLEFLFRIIVLVVFVYDIICFRKLQYCYHTVYFFLYVYMLKYYIYFLKTEIEDNIAFVDERVTTQLDSILEPIREVKECIEYQSNLSLSNKEVNRFVLVPKYSFINAEANKGNKFNTKKVLSDLRDILASTIRLKKITVVYYNYRENFISLQTGVLIAYLICWIYILTLSIHTLSYDQLNILYYLFQSKNIADPFSDSALTY